MKPIDFPESNVVFAKDQPEYLPLPAVCNPKDPSGETTFGWKLSWRDRWDILRHGEIWQSVLTFKQPIQPQLLAVKKPEFGLVSYGDAP